MTKEKRQINRGEPTEADKRAAAIIRAAWEKMKKDRASERLSQLWLGEQLGMSQGGVGHYINGNRKIGLEVLLKFCKFFELSPAEVYPEKASNIDSTSENVADFIALYKKAPKEKQAAILVLLTSP